MIKSPSFNTQSTYPVNRKSAILPSKSPQVSFKAEKKDSIHFGVGESSSSGLSPDGIEGGIESLVASWAFKKVLASFRLSEAEKQKLKEHGMPDEFFKGLNKLKAAEINDNIESEVREAKFLFDLAADKTPMQVYKAANYRLAAISSKLLEEPVNALVFMDKSKNALKSSKERPDDEEVTQDIKTLYKNVSYADEAFHFLKLSIALPFAIIEKAGQSALGKPKNTPLTTEKAINKASPFPAAIMALTTDFQKKHDELKDGEDSDHEWLVGNDRKTKGKSTGKGMRHQIPLVEKRRLAKLAKAEAEGKDAETEEYKDLLASFLLIGLLEKAAENSEQSSNP